jgi:hypothetical protein
MAEFKAIEFKVDDLVTLVGAAAGVYINNPEQAFMVKLALTQAQAEICETANWTWLRSTGYFCYSANTSTVNLYSVSSGKYKAFGQIETMRLGRTQLLNEIDAQQFIAANIAVSSASYPSAYMRIGEASIRWQPLPTEQHSVYFTFKKRPGFVHGNDDVVIPKRWVMTALVPLARNKVWEMKGDPRSGQPNSTYEKALAAMRRADAKPVATHDFRAWNPAEVGVYDPVRQFSGFWCTGVARP